MTFLRVICKDEHSGFIHLSTGVQVPGTLKHFFAEETKVYVLRIKYEVVEKNIRWEDPKAEVCGPRWGEGLFPHLYNGKLGCEEVESIAVWTQVDGQWDDALEKAQNWLI